MIRSRFRYYTATNTSYELVITLEADRKETGQSRCTVRIHRSYTATNTLFITSEAVGVALVAGGGFSAQIQDNRVDNSQIVYGDHTTTCEYYDVN